MYWTSARLLYASMMPDLDVLNYHSGWPRSICYEVLKRQLWVAEALQGDTPLSFSNLTGRSFYCIISKKVYQYWAAGWAHALLSQFQSCH